MSKATASKAGSNGTEPDKRLPIASLIKSLRVLEQLAMAGDSCSVADLIERSGLGRTTVQRVLRTLHAEDYVERTARGEYAIAPRGYVLGVMLSKSNHLAVAAAPVLRELQEKSDEAVHLGVLDGADTVSILHFGSGRMLSFTFPVGARIPAYASTLGRAILAYMPREAALELLKQGDRGALTKATLTSIKDISAELDLTRERGYSLASGEVELGVAAVAAPVLGPNGEAIAAINVVVPTVHLDDRGGFDRVIPDLLEAAREISRRVGWTDSA
ncbi:MAG TPA: IclR family transcriptional regulator [Solirubrobacterales bacterium]|jgi:IclR family pca regulon transcriptional regulator